jgi:hypothetical protein
MIECGLGNNGGTRTIIRCSEILEKLGHKCDIVGVADKFTWFDHKPIIRHIPVDTDVIIATACTTVFSTLKTSVPKKVWYIRAHENWTMSDKELRKRYNSGIFNIVNSKGLQQLLASYGADSKIIYQGIDFDWWEDKKLRSKDKIRIGGLYTTQARKRWKDFIKLSKILGYEDYEYVSIGNAKPKEDFLTKSLYNIDHEKLCELYSSCHIWVSTSESEGLHNVPLEAALCKCLIVCSDHKLNGMVLDYAFDNTAMVYKFGDLDHAADLIRNPDWSLINNMQKFVVDKIGSREINMLKLIEILEK